MKRIFVFTNNSNQVDSVVDRPDFREMIQFAIDNGKYLQGYKHIGRQRIVTLQFSSFHDLLAKVKGLLASVRAWQVRNVVRERS